MKLKEATITVFESLGGDSIGAASAEILSLYIKGYQSGNCNDLYLMFNSVVITVNEHSSIASIIKQYQQSVG